MRDRKPAGNMLWAVLFCFAATFGFTGCGGSIDNVPTDANLSNLTVTPGALQPAFSGHITDYTVDVATSDTSVTVTAKPQDAQATVKINGQVTTSRSVSLGDPGFSTFVTIDVTSFNGNRKTYLVTVNRAAIVLSGNNNLSALDVSAGALEPPFDPGTTSYSMTVPNATKDTTVTATVADSTATLTINGSPATSGVPSASIHLDVGPNSILIVVTAQNGTPNPYTVLITRERKNSSED